MLVVSIETADGKTRWSQGVRSSVYPFGPQSAKGSDPSAFSVLPYNRIFCPQLTDNAYQ